MQKKLTHGELISRIYGTATHEALALLAQEWAEGEGLELEGTYRQQARTLPWGPAREVLHAFADRGWELMNPAERSIARRYRLA